MHYLLAVRGFIEHTVGAVLSVGSVWFISWAIRRKGELDYPLDLAAKMIRWVVVIVSIGIPANLPKSLTPGARVALFLTGVGFLAWPNFAYHLTRFLRWCRLLPEAQRPAPDGPAGMHG